MSDKTQLEQIGEYLSYNPDTGNIIWIKSRGSVKAGAKAGKFTRGNSGDRLHIMFNKKLYYASRLAWFLTYGSFPSGHIDHIDGNTLNNKLSNLRDVTQAENNKNAKMRKDNTTGVTGVYWDKRRGTWISGINKNGEQSVVGYYKDFSDAVLARKKAEIEYGYHQNHGVQR